VILLLTNANDSTAPLVEKELSALGAGFFRFNTEDYGTSVSLSSRIGVTGDVSHLEAGSIRILGQEVRSIWNRRPASPVCAMPGGASEAKIFAEEELHSALHGWLRSLDARWMSHPDSIRSAGYKLPQLRLARELGFRIPETLVSNNPSEIRDFDSFLRGKGGKLAAKLISKGPPKAAHPDEQYVVFTQILSESDLQNDATLGLCPAMYQEYVEKAFELRVTVAGNEIFACEIHSQQSETTHIDWRRYDLPNTPHLVHDASPELVRRCLEITRHFRLEFAAIDLIVTPEGETVFLELNPNGQWGWIEELTGMPIANAIARHLTRP